MRELLRKTEISSGGILLLSALVFFFDRATLLILFGNVLFHEWGHIAMLRRCGVYIRSIVISATGLCIHCNTFCLSRKAMFLCAAAGPLVGFAIAVLASIVGNLISNEWLLLFAGTGVILSCFNLLPAAPLDGYRMLHAVAPNLSRLVGAVTSCCVLICGLAMMYCGYGTGLAMMGIVLVVQDASVRMGVKRLRFT